MRISGTSGRAPGLTLPLGGGRPGALSAERGYRRLRTSTASRTSATGRGEHPAAVPGPAVGPQLTRCPPDGQRPG
jgi:hypothetical protein